VECLVTDGEAALLKVRSTKVPRDFLTSAAAEPRTGSELLQ
jgi:hypothetical protein